MGKTMLDQKVTDLSCKDRQCGSNSDGPSRTDRTFIRCQLAHLARAYWAVQLVPSPG